MSWDRARPVKNRNIQTRVQILLFTSSSEGRARESVRVSCRLKGERLPNGYRIFRSGEEVKQAGRRKKSLFRQMHSSRATTSSPEQTQNREPGPELAQLEALPLQNCVRSGSSDGPPKTGTRSGEDGSGIPQAGMTQRQKAVLTRDWPPLRAAVRVRRTSSSVQPCGH